MKYSALLIVLVGLSSWLQGVNAVSGQQIADIAKSHNDSTLWSYASSHRTGVNTDKCNIFVAGVLEEAGASVPHRWWFKWSPIGAGEWGNPRSSYLTKDKCWTNRGPYMATSGIGYVIGDGEHVGIVTGNRETTSAAEYEVLTNDWGFQVGQTVTFWKYTC